MLIYTPAQLLSSGVNISETKYIVFLNGDLADCLSEGAGFGTMTSHYENIN